MFKLLSNHKRILFGLIYIHVLGEFLSVFGFAYINNLKVLVKMPWLCPDNYNIFIYTLYVKIYIAVISWDNITVSDTENVDISGGQLPFHRTYRSFSLVKAHQNSMFPIRKYIIDITWMKRMKELRGPCTTSLAREVILYPEQAFSCTVIDEIFIARTFQASVDK